MIRLHHVPWSRSFRILWLLQEMGLDCEIVPYAIGDGSMRTPEFMAISPAGRVPALEVDGRTLFESGAISEYLCETRPEHGLGRPPDHEDRAEYLEWLHYAETVAHVIAYLNLQWIFLRDPAMRSEAVMKIDAARLRGMMRDLDRRLEGREYLLPSGFSAADTMFGFNLWAAPRYAKLDGLENLKAYVARCTARPGYQKAAAIDAPHSFYDREFYSLG